MQLNLFVFIVCIGVSHFITSVETQCATQFQSCVENTEYRTTAQNFVIPEAKRTLNTVRVFVQLARGVYNLSSVPLASRLPLRQVLSEVFPDALQYLTPVNVSFFERFYEEGFQLADEFFYRFTSFNLNDVDQSVSDLIMALDDGYNLGIDIANTIVSESSASIIMQIEAIHDLPGLVDNVICLLQQVVRDPNINDIVAQLDLLYDLFDDAVSSFVSPIARLFRDDRSIDKFNQIIQQLDTSPAIQLCIDSLLTNALCPQFQELASQVCEGVCVDISRYCTAYLFQSLEDFVDVFETLSLLTFEEVQSTEFATFYNDSIEFSLEVLNTTLFALENLNVLALVTNSITTCQSETIISSILQMANQSISPGEVTEFFTSIIPEDPIAGVTSVYDSYQSLTQTIPYQNINSSVQAIQLPNGYITDQLFSLAIQNTRNHFPGMGCGQILVRIPLLLDIYTGYRSSCWNGTGIGGFRFPTTFLSALPEDVRNNPVALRTCSYSDSSFTTARIVTETNFCNAYSNVISNPRIANFLSTILSSEPTVLPTCRSSILLMLNAPIPPAPNVNFQLATYLATINAPLTAICVTDSPNVQLQIFSLNGTDLNFTITSQSPPTQQITLAFTPNTLGTYIFACQGSNQVGDARSRTTVVVRSFSDNLNAISTFSSSSVIEPEQAVELLSVLGSLANTEEVQSDATSAQQFADTTFAVADSLENTNISSENAGALLVALESVERIPVLMTTSSPPEPEPEANLEVSELTVRVSQAIDSLSLNLARQAQIGNPPTIIQSSDVIVAAVAIQPSDRIFTLDLPDVRVSFPLSFGNFERIEVGAAIRTSLLRALVQTGQQVVAGSIPLLNSDLFNLNIVQNGISQPVFNPPITFELGTSLISEDAENICVFLDEITREFRPGDVVTANSSVANVTICQTSHLTSFGVLVRSRNIQFSRAETLAISIVSYALLSISLIFLVASLILFLISAKSFFKVETNILYFNYAVALALATSVFIFGIQSARNSLVGCSIVGFLMHYTWLSVFSWSFAISVFMIYVLYFGILNRKKIWWLMMIIGWGLPLPFVIITIAVGASRNQYINIGDHCFLSYVDGLIWAFLGPFIILIIASSVGAILALIKIILTLRNKGDKPPSFDMMVNLVVTILVLVPVLSIPWIIGVVNAFITAAVTTTVIEWVTVLFTAPVGVLFFIMVALRNPQVQEVIFQRKLEQTSSISKPSSGAISTKYALPKAQRKVTLSTTSGNSGDKGPTVIENEKEVLRNIYETEHPGNVGHQYMEMDPIKDAEKNEPVYENPSLDVNEKD